MRKIGAEQDEVAIVVLPDVVADESQTAGVQRQRQFELRMMVPLERNPVIEATVQHAPRGVGGLVDFLKERLHWAATPS